MTCGTVVVAENKMMMINIFVQHVVLLNLGKTIVNNVMNYEVSRWSHLLA